MKGSSGLQDERKLPAKNSGPVRRVGSGHYVTALTLASIRSMRGEGNCRVARRPAVVSARSMASRSSTWQTVRRMRFRMSLCAADLGCPFRRAWW